jgi:hypothetical protein
MKAFPNMTSQQGMDLRDYFAAQAMQAMLSSGKWGPRTADQLHYDDDRESNMHTAGCLAQGAYEMADAMIKAREI